MSYNILCEKYCRDDSFAYCPNFALDFSYRYEKILNIFKSYDPDIFGLQELEAGVLGNLREALPDYSARYIKRPGKVDGCGIFFKNSKFKLLKKICIDFNDISNFPELKQFHKKTHRFITSNVGLILLLEHRDLKDYNSQPLQVWVSNVHYFWNPQYHDVKLMQAYYTVLTLEKLMDTSNVLPVIVLGDFNSTPDSNVYEFFNRGVVAKKRIPTLLNPYFNFYHSLTLTSAYSPIRSPFTNITPGFIGCLDYIWYCTSSFKLMSVVSPVEQDVLIPNTDEPSDHSFLMAKLCWKDVE